MNVSDFLVQRLLQWGVHRIYGFPGDGIGEFDGALGRADREGLDFTYIRPTHEEICALMATAHAKFTGEVGVCVATSSPGAFHMLNGLYDAKMDNQPVVAIVGQQPLASFGTSNQQENHLERTFSDVAVYVETIVTPEQAEAVIDRAFREATTRLGPAVIVFPHDVQAMEMREPGLGLKVSRSKPGAPSTALRPPLEDISRAAAILNEGKKVAMLVGAGARGAGEEVVAVAEALGAGIITALRGKDVVSSDVPYHTQHLGLLGSRPSLRMSKECDTLFLIGTNYPYGKFLPETGQARAVQIDLKPGLCGLRYPTDVNLWGDAKTTLEALLPMLERKPDRSWQQQHVDGMVEWEDEMKQLAQDPADPVNPRLVFHELNQRLPDNAIITCDAGTTADWYGHYIRLRNGMRGDLSGRLATMLAAMPYATAAKFAHPDRCVVCTIGDGAFQMLGMNELITIKKYMAKWTNKQFIILVLHNDDLTQVSWEMRTEDANPRWPGSQAIQTMDYAGYAELLGFKGVKIEKPEDVGPALDAAFAHQGVTLVDAHTDKNTPPLPPKISFEYAKNTGISLLKGDKDLVGVVKDSARDLLTEGVTRAKHALHLDGGDSSDDNAGS